MASTPKEKFEAAVKVIQSLPKNVSPSDMAYRPPNSTLLKLYALYKQSTEGQVSQPRPAFWDIINKAKWDAWNKLGDMPQEEAMLSYVEELKKIIETMPHTEMVADFVDTLGAFYEVVEEKPKENGDITQLQESPVKRSIRVYQKTRQSSTGESDLSSTHSTSPSSATESSPEKMEEEEEEEQPLIPEALKLKASLHGDRHEEDEAPTPNGEINGHTNGHHMTENGLSDSGSEADEFCDTSDNLLDEDGNSSMNPQTSSMVTQAEVYEDHRDREQPVIQEAPPSAITNSYSQSMLRDPSSSNLIGQSLTSPQQLSDRQFSSVTLTALDSYGVSDAPVTVRGGGDNPQGDSRIGMIPRSGSNTSIGSQGRGATSSQSQPSSRRAFAAGGGAPGGGRDQGPYKGTMRPDMTDQIAQALTRLQQDMNSVLTRLNTLETISLAQHQAAQDRRDPRQPARRPWWSFLDVSGRTLFFMVVWPFIVHWIIRFLSRRRGRRN